MDADQTRDVAQLTLRPLDGYDELTACSMLQLKVWGESYFDAVPPAILLVAQKIGGLVAGAFDSSGALIAFVFGLPADRNGRRVHWSHMLAVLPAWRSKGVGAMLKQLQKDFVLNQGLRYIHWTYDPLESVNAHLNLNRLGALPEEYVLDLYGDGSTSTLNNIIGTDRFILSWRLHKQDEQEHAAGFAGLQDTGNAPFVVFEEEGTPKVDDSFPDKDVVKIQIPVNIQRVKADSPETARDWRMATRAAFTHYFGLGYTVMGFQHESTTARSFYLMCRPISR